LDVAFFLRLYHQTEIIWTPKAAIFDRGQSQTRDEYRMNWVWINQLRKDDHRIDRFIDLAPIIDPKALF
jgi:hypothetical protein